MTKLVGLLIILLLASVPLSGLGSDINDRRAEPESGRYWIFLSDRGKVQHKLNQALTTAELPLSERAIARRISRSGVEGVLQTDIPVREEYIKQLKNLGLRIRVVSRFLNAVSVYADIDDLAELSALPFVDRIKPVATYRRSISTPTPREKLDKIAPQALQLDYGPSYGQLAMVNVPPLHEKGLNGKDVLIGVFDTGFLTDHPAFGLIDILAAYDFINNDADVGDNDQSQMDHGTAAFSVIGGRDEGNLIGPAFGATYILAKTEDVRREVRAEEDNFIAALEWADSIGCDLITASLGYIDWYTFSDLDGDTSPLTAACDAAVQRGITVVAAAGNGRHDPWGHINVPADGDSVIAVGAVNPDSLLSSFSSPGPTADGRIKPDVMAQGTVVTSANLFGGYSGFSGTSAATPLAAGAIALLLQSHPNWGPIDIRTALRATATQPVGSLQYPNNDYGYGIVNAAAADTFEFEPVLLSSVDSLLFRVYYEDLDTASQIIDLTERSGLELEWTAAWDSTWLSVGPVSGITPDEIAVAVDITGLTLGDYREILTIESDSASNSPLEIPIHLTIREGREPFAKAYPNPFTDKVWFEFDRLGGDGGSIHILAVDGSHVFELDLSAGTIGLSWDGRNSSGEEVAGGYYLVKITGIGMDGVLKIYKAR